MIRLALELTFTWACGVTTPDYWNVGTVFKLRFFLVRQSAYMI